MKASERVQKIAELQAIETPHDVWRFIGKLSLHGDQLELQGNEFNDFGTLDEFRTAVSWLVDQLGGVVVWDAVAKQKKVKK